MERYATRTAFPKSSNTCVRSIPAELPLKKSPMDRARVKKNAHNPGDSTEVTMNTLRAEIIDKTIGLPWPYNSEFYERVRISRIRIIPTKTRPKFLIFLNKNNNLRKLTTATAGVIRPESSHPCSYLGAYNSAPENPTS